jgi:hypothetical protein
MPSLDQLGHYVGGKQQTGQRGLVKSFNAVKRRRPRQKRRMEAMRGEGVRGLQKREEDANEMNK